MAYDSPPHERIENVRAERDRYRRRLDRAAELHANNGHGYCAICMDAELGPTMPTEFPCPTYRALTED